VLESITRDTVIKIADSNGIPVIERTIDRTELYTCDEAFLCGSAMEMTPVLSVDKHLVGTGETGLLTKKLHLTYLDAVYGKVDIFKDWVTAIY
jgi:branched-chain amino acid aminotransferase